MLKDQIPTGILKVDYDIPLLNEIHGESAYNALSCLSHKLKDMPKEASFVLCLDYYYRPICIGLLGYGMTDSVEMSVKETVQFALLTNARAVVLMHNHPGNGRKLSDLTPSKKDVECASRISEALKLFEIELNDSIIFNCEWTQSWEDFVKYMHPECADKPTRMMYQRLPAFYSMREHRRYRAVFNPNPDKNIDLLHPNFTGEDLVNTPENEEHLIHKENTEISNFERGF